MTTSPRNPETPPLPPQWSPSTDVVDDFVPHPEPQVRRRTVLPVLLLAATCLSTFWVGTTDWLQVFARPGTVEIWPTIVASWPQGLAYMSAVMAILLAHEMGHFLVSVRYRVPASYPFFIPVPFFPFGTMGAVIGLHGAKANRRQLFDLGIAGPLAGLVIAIPVLMIGIQRFVPTEFDALDVQFHNPLLMQWMMSALRPELETPQAIAMSQFNPCLMAGWVGLLITGLNMLPASQLDGGHVLYGLLGRKANRVARTLLILAILFILVTETYIWVPMLILVTVMGVDHPRTADDSAQLGWARQSLGFLSLSIPFLCFPVWGVK